MLLRLYVHLNCYRFDFNEDLTFCTIVESLIIHSYGPNVAAHLISGNSIYTNIL